MHRFRTASPAFYISLSVALMAACSGDSESGSSTSSNSSAARPDGKDLPCDVKAIVDAKCAATCHSDPPQGTYMTLETWAQFHAQGTTDKSKQYWELAKTRINASNNPMPPVTADALSADEKATLDDWLNQGAPAGRETCTGEAAGDSAPDLVDPSAIDTTGLQCYKFLAHAQGDKSGKFKVGSAVDAYYFFGFQAPWTGTVYGAVVRPVVDNQKVLHHWLLYKEQVQDGSIQKTIGQHSGGELIHGWAPGGIAMDFRKHGDVGFELPATTYGIEFHYNSSDPEAMDASGVELCVQTTPPANIASMSWVGYDQGGVLSYASGICLAPSDQWTGTCAPQSQEPIHLLFVTPHLHQAGRHLKSVITGTDGTQRVLHDKPFDFSYQVTYETNDVLMPGEKITTTCSYSEPKCAGQSTSQEMCYLFTYAYPKHALTDNGIQGKLMHGEGVCLGQ
jgi:hypothetical protein